MYVSYCFCSMMFQFLNSFLLSYATVINITILPLKIFFHRCKLNLSICSQVDVRKSATRI